MTSPRSSLPLLAVLLPALLPALGGCTFGGDVLATRDAGTSTGAACAPGPASGIPWRELAEGADPHVVDGAFTGDEWSGVRPLEGLYTDAYLDVRGGFLYVLNDWRANDEGIQPGCFNLFSLLVAGQPVVLRVYQDGHVEVEGAPWEGQGAYGFGASPRYPTPHTIYEFRLPVPEGTIDVCCLDPVTRSECDVLTEEPMVFSIQVDGEGVRARRTQAAAVSRLVEGAACGGGEGVCQEGLGCVSQRCVPEPMLDGGLGDAGPDDDGGPPGDGGPDAGPS